eukprot:scaffold42932_cov103-Attheya_sp.AAC.1
MECVFDPGRIAESCGGWDSVGVSSTYTGGTLGWLIVAVMLAAAAVAYVLVDWAFDLVWSR